ncbi:hypothetical protein EVG20_g4650 [Dentipellis fragilis]|uniref:T6SS Phospholipase effector Tle1-like catalytic domain-containing protein n=1 Tax=Dentipellis fragilis TaxID=205917 RepID=A0A4Y9YV41_9AGAM|nr:hypothetical protein EVG20_g4650 [Dentipellis fragilis]
MASEILTDTVPGPSSPSVSPQDPIPAAPKPNGTPVMVRKPRTIVLCFDGTANEYDETNTNVVKFFSLLKKDCNDDQLCYYQAGVGTYFQPGVVSPAFRWAAKILDEAVAWYLPAHVMDGYKFLMQNYITGDKICLFAARIFSRRIHARALAGMVHKVGLLPRDNDSQVPFAYKLYASAKHSNETLAAGFKATFSREVPIEFLGVWDTVASVGIIFTRSLPFVTTNKTIKTFRHALSLDEHRAKFRPNLYNRPPPNGSPSGHRSEPNRTHLLGGLDALLDEPPTDDDDKASMTSEKFTTDVKEVWFSGCHSAALPDVGGGAVEDTAEYSLANVALNWMVREVMLAQCGILFDDAALNKWNIPTTVVDAFKPKRASGEHKRQTSLHDYIKPPTSAKAAANGKEKEKENGVGNGSGNGKARISVDGKARVSVDETVPTDDSDKDHEAEDVVQPINDELKLAPLWWLLEVVPTKYAWQNPSGKWITKWSFHLGRGRWVPSDPVFHESVKQRMGDPALKYTPRARYQQGTETYVE